jgi:peptidyl-prolyl cis-trans isomerase SurA
MKRLAIALLLAGVAWPAGAPQDNKKIIEEIVARVNNEIITLSDLKRARQALAAEVEEECRRGCTPEQRAQLTKEKEEHMLRDLIDQSLLVQRGKDAGINVQGECIKRMDQIRQQNSIPTMEDLEKAVNDSGIVFEDWKSNLCNSILTQEVIRKEVRPDISNDDVKKYYAEHPQEFQRKERVFLSEIFVTLEGKKEEEFPAQEEKARKLLERIKNGGEDFNELAKRFSDGTTAQEGGFLGNEGFTPDALPKELSEIVFKMKRGDVSEMIKRENGFLILKVEQRFSEGLQPLEVVESEIQNKIYYEKLRPAMREYLKKLREESYVVVKPGYVDSAAVAATPISEVEPEKPKDEGEESGKRKWKRLLGIPIPIKD